MQRHHTLIEGKSVAVIKQTAQVLGCYQRTVGGRANRSAAASASSAASLRRLQDLWRCAAVRPNPDGLAGVSNQGLEPNTLSQ